MKSSNNEIAMSNANNNSIEPSQNTAANTRISAPLQINDLFWTLQGEGRWTGRRALFVRLPFCNYDCPWCDSEYNSFKKISEDEFLQFTKQESARFAVITGGEPMAHKDLPRIIMLLKKEGFEIACETNGSLPIPAAIDFPTVSPKRFTQKKYPEFFIHEDALTKAKELKYVVDSDFDFKILDRHNISTNDKSSVGTLETDRKNTALSAEGIPTKTIHNGSSICKPTSGSISLKIEFLNRNWAQRIHASKLAP
jgi:organic radical activating enzyme